MQASSYPMKYVKLSCGTEGVHEAERSSTRGRGKEIQELTHGRLESVEFGEGFDTQLRCHDWAHDRLNSGSNRCLAKS